jgi:hypothetical protein
LEIVLLEIAYSNFDCLGQDAMSTTNPVPLTGGAFRKFIERLLKVPYQALRQPGSGKTRAATTAETPDLPDSPAQSAGDNEKVT